MIARRIAIAATSLALTIGAFAVASPLHGGIFALQTGHPNITSRFAAIPAPGKLAYTFDILQQRDGSSRPLRDYEIDYDKLLHLVVISDDFKTFLHLHPALRANGHFRGTFAMPRAARYLAYVDSHPVRSGQQVFRFAFNAGRSPAMRPDPGKPTAVSTAGPYLVSLDRSAIAAGRENVLHVHINKAGLPARDLHGYLGGAAHAVFINEATLTYAHVHPTLGSDASMAGMAMAMDGEHPPAVRHAEKVISDTAHVPADYALHVGAQSPGRYRLWLQFRGGRGLYVAPFIVVVR